MRLRTVRGPEFGGQDEPHSEEAWLSLPRRDAGDGLGHYLDGGVDHAHRASDRLSRTGGFSWGCFDKPRLPSRGRNRGRDGGGGSAAGGASADVPGAISRRFNAALPCTSTWLGRMAASPEIADAVAVADTSRLRLTA